MRKFLASDNMLVLLSLTVILAAVAGICAIGYYWWFGVLTGMAHFGVPMIIGFIIAVLAIMVTPNFALLVLSGIGLWASFMLLDTWWFWAICLYATGLVVLFIGVIFNACINFITSAFIIFTGR